MSKNCHFSVWSVKYTWVTWQIWLLLFSINFLCKYASWWKFEVNRTFLSEVMNNFHNFVKFWKFSRSSTMESSPELVLWIWAVYQTFSKLLVPRLTPGGTRLICLPRWCIPTSWAWSKSNLINFFNKNMLFTFESLPCP